MSDSKGFFEKFSIFSKLKNIKHIEIIIAVIFAIIIFLIYLSSTGASSLLSSNSSQTDFEKRLCMILEDIEGAGDVSVFVNEVDSRISGIIVVSSGASSVKVKLDILRAIETVLSVPTSNIEILVGNK